MKLLGVDLGERRVGLALGESEGRVAAPWKTLVTRSPESLAVELARIVAEEEIGEVILGDPISLDGTSGHQSRRVRAFSRDLATHIGPVPISLVDERLTSRLADRVIAEQGGDRDALAAAAILQSYLNSETV